MKKRWEKKRKKKESFFTELDPMILNKYDSQK